MIDLSMDRLVLIGNLSKLLRVVVQRCMKADYSMDKKNTAVHV